MQCNQKMFAGGGGGQFDDVFKIVQCAWSGSFVLSLFDLLYFSYLVCFGSYRCLFLIQMIHLYTNICCEVENVHTRTSMTRFFWILIYHLVDLISFRHSVASIVCSFFYILFCTLFFSICTFSPSLPSLLPPMPKPQLSTLPLLSLCFSLAQLYIYVICWNHTLKTNTFFQIHTHTQTDDYNSSSHFR